MICHGSSPYLEASSAGDRRFSAFYARIEKHNFQSIEEIYQSAKIFEDGRTNLEWREAKGKKAINQEEVSILYEQLWRDYLLENQYLLNILVNASGISDRYGQVGHNCQATVLFKLRNEFIEKGYL